MLREAGHRLKKTAKSTCSGSSLSFSAEFDEDKRCLVGVKSCVGAEESEFDLNVSFSGGYVPNTDLSRVDKGQGNP